MPNVIGALIIEAAAYLAQATPEIAAMAAAATFTIGGVTITYASVIGATVLIAASIGLQLLLAPSITPQNGQFSITQAVPFRRRVYGRAKIGGIYIFWDSQHGALFSLIAIASHQIDAIEEHWLGDRQVTINDENFVDEVVFPPNAAKFQFGNGEGTGQVVEVYSQLGGAGKTSYARLQAIYPGIWTAQHIGLGVADVLTVQHGVKQEDFSTVYPGGPQSWRGVIRGALIADPRNLGADDAWTDNAVCVLRDYLTNADGWRIKTSFFDTGAGLPITQASAYIADQTVPLSSGGNEPRYRIWGFYDFSEEPRMVLARMLAACGGWLQPQLDGTIGIRVGAWIEPTVTISDPYILSYDVQHYLGIFDVINEVRGTFNYGVPGADYQQAEADPWQNTADIERLGYIKSTTLDTRHCPTYTQTRRIQKIGYYEATPEWTVNLVTRVAGLAARNQRFINLVIAELGLSITCRVTSFAHNLKAGTCTIGLASFTSDAYAWGSTAAEEGNAPPVPADTSNSGLIETPIDFSAVVETSVIDGGVAGTYLVLSVQAPTDRSDLAVRFEYQLTGSPSTQWTAITLGGGNFSYPTGLLPTGTYNARASFLTSNSQQSTFAEIEDIIVSPSTAAPPPPTDLSATTSSPAETVLLTFTAPNSPNFYAGAIWRSNDTTFADAINVSGPIYGSPNQVLTYTESPGAGTWFYWATTQNAATPPNFSVPDGPQSVTVS